MKFGFTKAKFFTSILLGFGVTAYPAFRTYWIPGPGPMFVFDSTNFSLWGFYGLILSLVTYVIYSLFQKK